MMSFKSIVITLLAICLSVGIVHAQPQKNKDPKYVALRDTLVYYFNNDDSIHFYAALSDLENYLLAHDDLHGYYTQRCNEIIFLMNRQQIFEAYKLSRKLIAELQEKKLDSEMYMAVNMMGHINSYCGNIEAAKANFREVIERMEKQGYYESMPPIYMNIVNLTLTDNAEEALSLLDKAREIAVKYSPERVFDIDTRKTVSYFSADKKDLFMKGYEVYRKGVEEGQSSVHGRLVEAYHEAAIGNTEKAVEMARQLGDDGHEAITIIYEKAGMWEKAFNALNDLMVANDSITNVVLINSMQGLQDDMASYEREREVARARMIGLTVIIVLLFMLVVALFYIVNSRRRHTAQLRSAYEHALESDKMKRAFIRNVSHQIRTPLNIVSGFSQLLADPTMQPSLEERRMHADMISKNTELITSLVDEILELSENESTTSIDKNDVVQVCQLLHAVQAENSEQLSEKIKITVECMVDENFAFRSNAKVLKRVLNILIENAKKYTVAGTITLAAQLDERQLIMSVTDTGIGVSEADAERIFESFVKLDDFKEGLGLGLSLCRVLVKHLGGVVSLDTTYRQGARFVITLPVYA